MIELRILNGKMAGRTLTARHFPFRIGRAPDCQLRLLEDGIWDNHLEFIRTPEGKIKIRAGAGAVAINGTPQTEAFLKIGDTLRIANIEIECWYSFMKQYDMNWLNYALWIGGLLLMMLQIFLLCILH